MYAQRLEAASDIRNMLRAIFRAQKIAFKINLAFGFILSNVETGEKRYYYPSQNGLIFNHPLVVADEADLEKVLQRVGETDWLEYVRQQKPNSKWRIALLTNVTFHLYSMQDRPVGRNKIVGQSVAQVAGRESRSGCPGKRQMDWPVVRRPLVLFSMLGTILGLRFEEFGKKDPRIGLYLLGHAGAAREFRGRAFERFTRAG